MEEEEEGEEVSGWEEEVCVVWVGRGRAGGNIWVEGGGGGGVRHLLSSGFTWKY